jgi:hypothetical protein
MGLPEKKCPVVGGGVKQRAVLIRSKAQTTVKKRRPDPAENLDV